jgi:hypothetical protein
MATTSAPKPTDVVPGEKSNCWIIRNSAKSTGITIPEDIAAHIEPLSLKVGDEAMEMLQIRTALKWKKPRLVGKFYSHNNIDTWYYEIFCNSGFIKGSRKNAFSSLLCSEECYGDLAIIKAAPDGLEYHPSMEKGELCKTIEFYKTHDRNEIFQKRERSLANRDWQGDEDTADFHASSRSNTVPSSSTTTTPSASNTATGTTGPSAPSTEKHNCYILRAGPKDAILSNVSAYIEPLDLKSLGNESLEKAQLTSTLSWTRATEVGKFYDHLGSDSWYYYVYGNSGAPPKNVPKNPNPFSKLVCYGDVYGDLAVVRSGPMGAVYEELFGKEELVGALEWYKGRDHKTVFGQREMSRMMGQMGMGEGGGGGRYFNVSGNGFAMP